MARPLVFARPVLLALACALGPAAAAEVNYSLQVGTRVWEGDVTLFELGDGVGAQHQFDFGPAPAGAEAAPASLNQRRPS